MDLPTELTMRETMHGHGANGMAFYGYEDTAGLGVQMQARRGNSRCPFVETWFHTALPEREFPTYQEMREAVAQLTDEAIAAEAARHPHFRSVREDSCGNACRLCPRPPYRPGPRIKHETWRLSVATNWRAVTDRTCSLCADHMAQFQAKPAELLTALEAEVEGRKARAAAKGLPW